jgi:hypothetical protein
MNQLTKHLISELLDNKQVVAIFGGGFKPPTKGHFAVVEKALEEFKEIDKFLIYVGSGVRDGITQEQSMQVWDYYKDLLGNKVEILPSSSPIGDIIRYGRDNPDQIVYFILGERNEQDKQDIEQRTKNIEEYPNIKVKTIKTPDVTDVSGTEARKILLNPKSTLEDYSAQIPDKVPENEKQQIFDLLKKGIVNEGTCGYDTDAETGKKLDTPGGLDEADPKTGTGKKPKGSGRRLYTDENPKDTVRIKFSTKQDIIDTLSKESFKSKSHARQSQIINLIHQRVRAAYGRAKDSEVKSRLKNALDYIEGRKEASKKKTERLRTQKENVAPNHSGKSSPYGSGYKPLLLEISKFMVDQGMEIRPLPKIQFVEDDITNAQDVLGTTAYYNPQSKTIVLYTLNRHPKDILRSFCHEMIHHEQNIKGTLGDIKTQNTTEDSHLDEIEREAYEKGNIMFRNWEDNTKNPTKTYFLDIPKFNQPKTFVDNLCESLNEISLNPDNAAEIYGDLTYGKFQVGDIIYIYDIKQVKNPYDDEGKFYNISFHPQDNITSIPQQGKENYIKILNTMYKVILDFIKEAEPEYIGLSSLDNIGDKNYHRVYANLTNNKHNKIPGYFRKDANLSFDGPRGKGRFVVLKKTWQSENLSVYSSYGVKENSGKMREEKGDGGTGGYEIYCDMDGVLCDFDKQFKKSSGGISPEEFETQHGKKEFWKLISNQGVGFWVGMPWIPDGKELWEYIKPYNPLLLSAPSSEESSRLGKRLWVKNNIPGTKLILRQAEQKQEFANPNSILIDDRTSNINQWRAKGGIGILHTSTNNTLKQLKKYGL